MMYKVTNIKWDVNEANQDEFDEAVELEEITDTLIVELFDDVSDFESIEARIYGITGYHATDFEYELIDEEDIYGDEDDSSDY